MSNRESITLVLEEYLPRAEKPVKKVLRMNLSVHRCSIHTVIIDPNGIRGPTMAKGYTQTYRIDYSETFSPVAKINTIRVLCSVAANKGRPLHQFDVIKCFLTWRTKRRSLYGSPTWIHKQVWRKGNEKEEITKLKKYLFTEFEMKDLGRLKYFLGIEVLRSKQRIFMCQKRYILDLLAETGMIDCKPADTPMIGTTGNGVLFKPNGHLVTQLYTDADWEGDKGNRRSTSGYFTIVGENLVTWRSKKQKVVFLSSAEAEFRGIARGLTKVLWVRRLLTEIGYPPQVASKIMSDNKAAIQISKNPVQHDRTKHVEVDRHFIKEKLEAEIITLPLVRSEDQLADILTKSVNERASHKCLDKLNFGDPTIQLEEEC
nr:putative ribonuclease H-like domain-containing protein [Tanacetum cinerariifolium]